MFRTRSAPISALALAVTLGAAALPAAAMQSPDAAPIWLDEAAPAWNAAGAAIPQAPEFDLADDPLQARCEIQVRAPETAEDRQLADAGWRLFGGYEAGWGLTVVRGFVAFDGMCRPTPYQVFVFADGAFAGTLAPEPMFPRTDGALVDSHLFAGEVSAEFDRYTPEDPLCCPSGGAFVRYAVEDGAVTVSGMERGS